ncbi:MAG TPA: AraC family transcriptional regulator, partial [Bradyrhizobium sp.]|nr:AraC family transcriptional regulator [Bradyrhizobium sp.]
MSKPTLRDSLQEDPSAASKAHPGDSPTAERRAADVEMARVLGTLPFRMALDPSGAGIAHWQHD